MLSKRQRQMIERKVRIATGFISDEMLLKSFLNLINFYRKEGNVEAYNFVKESLEAENPSVYDKAFNIVSEKKRKIMARKEKRAGKFNPENMAAINRYLTKAGIPTVATPSYFKNTFFNLDEKELTPAHLAKLDTMGFKRVRLHNRGGWSI